MNGVRTLGIILMVVGFVGLAYMYNAPDVVVSGYSMAFKAYPMSIKTADEKISPTLKQQIASARPDQELKVVLKLTAPTSMSVAQQQLVISQLQVYGFKPLAVTNYVANTIAGTVPAKNIDKVASNPYVDEVLADIVVAKLTSDIKSIEFLDKSVPMIGAPEVWKQGYTGQGVTVIEIDSGIQNNHPALMRNGKSLVLEEKVIVPGASDYTHWHGTHVAGIIASQDEKYKGVAPGIKGFVDIVAFDYLGRATLSWVLQALDYAYKVADKYKPAVCTNSWGGPAYNNPEVNEMREAALKLAEKIPVVFAAGNNGPGSGTIAAPGDADKMVDNKLIEVITVGAVDKSGTIAFFSSRGPDRWGTDHNEPDISAPGVAIYSTVPGGFRGASGTSMATPHVSGVVALMLSKNPNLDNMQVLDILTSTAKDAGPSGFDYAYGYGIVQADKAVALVPGGVPQIPWDTIMTVGLGIMVLLGFAMALSPRTFENIVAG